MLICSNCGKDILNGGQIELSEEFQCPHCDFQFPIGVFPVIDQNPTLEYVKINNLESYIKRDFS